MLTSWPSASGRNCSCLSTSVSRCPRSSWRRVAASSSAVPNWAKAASSRYCAKSSRRPPATLRIARVWGAPPPPRAAKPTVMAGRAPQEQRHLAVGPGMLGEVVVDDQRLLALLHELLAHGAAGVRRQVLEGAGVGGVGRHHHGVLHRPVLLQRRHQRRHLRRLLADRHVDADQVAALLGDHRVQADRRLPREAITDDQLSLATADEAIPDGHLYDATGGTDLVALPDPLVVAEDDGADGVFFQVQGHPYHVVGELQQLAVHAAAQAAYAGGAVAGFDHRPHVHRRDGAAELLYLLPDDRRYLFRSDRHIVLLARSSCSCRALALPCRRQA